MSNQTPCIWNPRDPEVLSDQLRSYDKIRARCPIAHSDTMGWSLFRHADVMTALNDPETFTNSSRHHAIPNALNGHEHTTHREALSHYFSATHMATVEPQCREIAIEVVDHLQRQASVDAVGEIANPIALRTMCLFMGWPQDLWMRVRDWIAGNHQATFERNREQAHRLADEYAAMVTEALDDHRRRSIQDDVTGGLMQTEIEGYQWTDADIVATLRNWVAGHGTVAAGIGIVIAHLAADQELQRRLRHDPTLIAVTIDEILRADGPLVANSRTTSKVAAIGDVAVSAGERVSLMWIAANRDPDVFADPKEIRVKRDQDDNLLYGAGIHYCLGAPLARLEMQTTIEILLDRTEEISLAAQEPLQREGYPGNGFAAVPLYIC